MLSFSVSKYQLRFTQWSKNQIKRQKKSYKSFVEKEKKRSFAATNKLKQIDYDKERICRQDG